MKKILLFLLVLTICFYFPSFYPIAKEMEPLLSQYQEYQNRFEKIKTNSDISANGFRIIENHVFPLTMKTYGDVTLIPALDERYHRMAVFLTDKDGNVVFKTDQLETNNRNKGKLEQPNIGIAAVSFQYLNDDELTDIVLITVCSNSEGHTYKVGDVLFQNEKGLYRDWRLSDNLNRFSMNKSVLFITLYVRDGYSTEFLYTATTKAELLEHGFSVAEEQKKWIQFEKMGKLLLLPGTYRMAEYTVYMIYLINEQGYIVWSFQPMGDYENLFEPKGIRCTDVDGDGLKDIAIHASYSFEGSEGEMIVNCDYSIYYQRTGGFYEDLDYKKGHPCREEDTLDSIVEKARAYWGWKS